MRTLTQSDLDKEQCTAPGCRHEHGSDDLYLRQECHPEAWMGVLYRKSEGNLYVYCAECREVIITVTVGNMQ